MNGIQKGYRVPDLSNVIIVVDSREPKTGSWEDHFSVPTVRGPLDTGDYSIVGCEEMISIERKVMSDLISCFCGERQRFTKELRRFQAIPSRWVIVEGGYRSLLGGEYRSQMNPKAAFESCIAMMVRFSIPVIMCEDPPTAARLAESILVRWTKEHRRVLNEMEKAARDLRNGTGKALKSA